MARSLRLWYVQYHEDEHWCLVAAETRSKAKALFHRHSRDVFDTDGEFVDIRACVCNKAELPDSVTEPHFFDRCEPWMCNAFRYGEGCEDCSNEAKKRQEEEGLYGTP